MAKNYTIHPYLPSEVGTFSDVHGDIDVLITTLRDVLGVIRKKINHKTGSKIQRDPELDIFLNLDLNEPLNKILYSESLNYEWCGKDKVVIIVGDILDGTRLDRNLIPEFIEKDGIPYEYTGNKNMPHYYPQVEYKILLFINAINDDAFSLEERTGIRQGTLIKVTGNHELLNIYPPTKIAGSSSSRNPIQRSAPYMFPIDLENAINKYKGLPSKPYIIIDGIEYTRFNFFHIGNPGYDALKKNYKLSYKIGNYIFVHGQLTSNLTWIDHDNITEILTMIPNYNDPTLGEFLKINNKLISDINITLNEGTGPLWERVWGISVSDNGPNSRIGNMSGIVHKDRIGSDTDFCNKISEIITEFCSSLPDTDPHFTGNDKTKSKGVNVVIGHCIQSESTIRNQPSMTFIDQDDTEYINQERSQTFLGNHIYYGPPLSVHPRTNTHYNPIIYGITTECIGSNQNRIYRVDVGSSRGFDHNANIQILNSTPEKVNTLNSLYFSRTPQALRIDLIGNQQAITRSKLINTIHNVPRPDLNLVIATLNEQGPQGIVNILDTYDKKYRKYKSKYLKKDS